MQLGVIVSEEMTLIKKKKRCFILALFTGQLLCNALSFVECSKLFIGHMIKINQQKLVS